MVADAGIQFDNMNLRRCFTGGGNASGLNCTNQGYGVVVNDITLSTNNSSYTSTTSTTQPRANCGQESDCRSSASYGSTPAGEGGTTGGNQSQASSGLPKFTSRMSLSVVCSSIVCDWVKVSVRTAETETQNLKNKLSERVTEVVIPASALIAQAVPGCKSTGSVDVVNARPTDAFIAECRSRSGTYMSADAFSFCQVMACGWRSMPWSCFYGVVGSPQGPMPSVSYACPVTTTTPPACAGSPNGTACGAPATCAAACCAGYGAAGAGGP